MADVRSIHDHLKHYDRHLARLEELRRLLQEELAAARSGASGEHGPLTGGRRVAEIEAALARMDRERYGSCASCASFIPFDQLLHAPHRTTCDACAVPPPGRPAPGRAGEAPPRPRATPRAEAASSRTGATA
ncbi:hypothetical protein ACGF0J_02365 [Nonomuraea sp. NPDC047897]|uniref:hypothetical protein n=1 Tax=Nonomuraea sp. NPDC047897 TaxID=3364346 RepID=UPI003716D2A7